MKHPVIAFALFVLSLQAVHANEETPVATVNGTPISEKTLQAYMRFKKLREPGFDVEKNRTTLINELVNRELMYQDALKRKLDKDPKILDQIEQQRINLLIKYAIRQATKNKPITEEEMKAE